MVSAKRSDSSWVRQSSLGREWSCGVEEDAIHKAELLLSAPLWKKLAIPAIESKH